MTDSTAHYRTPPDAVRALGVAVTGAGRIVGQSSTRVRRTLTGYAGVLVTAGSGHLELHGGAGPRRVQPGSFFWLPPGVPHSYGPTGGTWDEYWILCEGPATARYEDLGYLGGAPARPADLGGVRTQFVRLLDLLAQPESLANHVAAAAAVHTLISLTGTGTGSDQPPEPAPARQDIGHRAVELLASTDGPVRIGAIAKELAVSRDTLATAVRRLTGSTPTDYLMRRRLDRAKVLLAGTDRPVAHIAREVGYPDPAYFTRVFTRYVGDPPTVFRRQQS